MEYYEYLYSGDWRAGRAQSGPTHIPGKVQKATNYEKSVAVDEGGSLTLRHRACLGIRRCRINVSVVEDNSTKSIHSEDRRTVWMVLSAVFCM